MGLVAACSGGSGAGGSTAGDVGVPEFTGPYAAEFAEAYRSAHSGFEREVLADGVISDAEHAEMVEKFKTCLGLEDVDLLKFEDNGAYSTTLAPNGVDTKKIVDDCAAASGLDTIGMISNFIAFDPENRDVPTVVAACLVAKGVVEPSYDAESYTRDVEGRFANIESLDPALRDAYLACSRDPFGQHAG